MNTRAGICTTPTTTQEKHKIQQYWTQRTEEFANLRMQERQSTKYTRWLREITTYLPKGDALRILDVGTGCGFFAVMLASCGHQVTGIDLTASMIQKGAQMAETAGVSVDLQVMDAEQLTFADELFDVVISRNLTWTLPDPFQAYREWLRVLKPGGALLNFDGAYGSEAVEGAEASAGLPPEHAHCTMSPTLQRQCDEIYRMLEISYLQRPQWDREALLQLGCSSCEVDTELGGRIYREIDRLYNPTPMFAIHAIK